jgi:S1-C subfamily serine protease
VLPQLKESGRVARAYLGITGTTIDKSLERLNLATTSGVLVQTVAPGSPAAKAGIHGGDAQATLDGSDISLGGDVIKRIDGRRVTTMDDVISAVNARKVGDSVQLELLRNGQSRTVSVTLGQRPERAPSQ